MSQGAYSTNGYASAEVQQAQMAVQQQQMALQQAHQQMQQIQQQMQQAQAAQQQAEAATQAQSQAQQMIAQHQQALQQAQMQLQQAQAAWQQRMEANRVQQAGATMQPGANGMVNQAGYDQRIVYPNPSYPQGNQPRFGGQPMMPQNQNNRDVLMQLDPRTGQYVPVYRP
jgi:hypothetical protein